MHSLTPRSFWRTKTLRRSCYASFERFLFDAMVQYVKGVVMFCPYVCFVQVTILKLVWRSRRADTPQCAHFPTDICSVIQEGEITEEKCAHRGASGAPYIVTWTKQAWT